MAGGAFKTEAEELMRGDGTSQGNAAACRGWLRYYAIFSYLMPQTTLPFVTAATT